MQRSELRDVTDTCRLRIDKEGKWYYKGSEIVNPLIFELFCEALEMDEEGRYRIVLEHEMCYVEVEDTPFVVVSLRGELDTGLSLLLNTKKLCRFDPGALCFGDGNVMYCTLPDGMKVRFSRAAYYMLAHMMEEDGEGNIVLKLKDRVYRIAPAGPEEG